jgi:hypothetical protein
VVYLRGIAFTSDGKVGQHSGLVPCIAEVLLTEHFVDAETAWVHLNVKCHLAGRRRSGGRPALVEGDPLVEATGRRTNELAN